MTHPLDDSRLLVARARDQFDALNSEVWQFWQDHPVEILYRFDPETHDQIFKMLQGPQFPRRWGVLLGEMVGNCISALNYVVIALIREWDGNDDRDSAFPISNAVEDYLKVGKGGQTYRDRLLDGVPENARKRVDQFQPWQKRDPLLDSLSILKALRDAALHHDLQAAYLILQLPTHTFQFPMDGDYGNVSLTLGENGNVSIQADVKPKRKTDANGIMWQPRRVPVKIPPTTEVAFGSARDNRFASLREIKEVVRWVGVTVEAFESEFPRAHRDTTTPNPN